MTLNRRKWKKNAKLAMSGNMSILIMGMLLTTLVNMIANSVTNFFFSGSGILTFILAESFSFVVSLVLNIFIAGYAYMNLKIARFEPAVLKDILYFFKNGSDRAIIAGFAMSAIQLLASVPMIIFNFTSKIGQTADEILQWEIRFLLLMVFTLVIQMILTIPFSMSYYLLADNPEMSGVEAIKGSLAMMKHHMGAYLLMEISFFPLIALSVFTFYFALIWVLPYMNMVEAEFYRDLNGEFIVQSAYVEKAEEEIEKTAEMDSEAALPDNQNDLAE